MSTASLPSYHHEPQEAEFRLALRERLRAQRPAGNFVKSSKAGGLALRLSGQEHHASLPEYGREAVVDGTIELAKTDAVHSVEVKIEGALRLKEIAEGGTSTSALCLDVKTLWSKDRDAGPCPGSLPFSLTLPLMFFDGKTDYPLPPTYEEHLSGLPGFRANIDYSVSAVVNRSKVSFFGLTNTVVSTPFVYRPRTRPASRSPPPLKPSLVHPLAISSDDWFKSESVILAKTPRSSDITSLLFIPASRVFSMKERIPFHLFFTGTAQALASFLPFAPATAPRGGTAKAVTRIQLLRQTIVDVRSITKRSTPLGGHQTDIWKTIEVGEGTFRHDGDGADWTAWSGEIAIDPQIKVGGFKASGLTVKDFVVLTMTPPEPGRSPFRELRQGVSVRLATDAWSGDGSGDIYANAEYSDPSIPEGYDEQPALNF